MPLTIGGITASVALIAGIIGGVDPIASLWRAFLAFVLGYVLAAVWYAIFGRFGLRAGDLKADEPSGSTP